MSAALKSNALFNTNSSPKSFYRYLPTHKQSIKIIRTTTQALELNSKTLQAIFHVVRTNPVDPKMNLAAKKVNFCGRVLRIVWTKKPEIEVYDDKGACWLIDFEEKNVGYIS